MFLHIEPAGSSNELVPGGELGLFNIPVYGGKE